MFNSSLRRVARTCPNATLPTRHNPATCVSSIAASASFTTRSHQRRASSSKPPIPPNNGSPSIPAASVKHVGASRSSDKRPGAESRLSKRKVARSDKTEQAKQVQQQQQPQQPDLGNEWVLKMPSVPSTQHLNPKDIYVASFFSTHRPLSISGPLPPETQIEDFDKIFQAKTKTKSRRNNPAEVIYTLNSAVQQLDETIQNQQHHTQSGSHQDRGVEQRVDIIKALTQHNNAAPGSADQTHHLDGQSRMSTTSNVKLLVQELTHRFRPYNTPPPPVPVPEFAFSAREDADDVSARQAEANEEMQAEQLEAEIKKQERKSSRTNARNKKNADVGSGRFFTSYQSPVSEPANGMKIYNPLRRQPTRGERSRRGMNLDPIRRRTLRYQLISVKRQRKLKMKKHKLNKLRKATRTLRRREGKI